MRFYRKKGLLEYVEGIPSMQIPTHVRVVTPNQDGPPSYFALRLNEEDMEKVRRLPDLPEVSE